MKGVVLLSGGVDSTTLAYLLRHGGNNDLHCISFDYGQRHRRELAFAARTAVKLGASYALVDLSSLREHLSGSALTDDVEVPDGHYADETMRVTVVPNRNAIMLNVAIGIAVAQGADFVAAAMHAGDHPIYPDCRPEFVDRLNDLARVATEGFTPPHFEVCVPFVDDDKTEVIRIGERVGVPWEDTWSCYRGGEVHCGRCSTCVERAEAFDLAGVPDPQPYADAEFWKATVGA